VILEYNYFADILLQFFISLMLICNADKRVLLLNGLPLHTAQLIVITDKDKKQHGF
jgi:hypothetical protein